MSSYKVCNIIAFIIILFFVGTCIIPVTSQDTEKPLPTSSNDWWPMFHHDIVHNGYSTAQAPNTNHVIWSKTIDNQLIGSSPAIINGKVYIGSQNGNVTCLRANNGTIIWSFKTNGAIEYSSPAVANGKVYIGSDDNKVYCLNAENGTKIWEYMTNDDVTSSPTVTDGKVYIGSDDENVYCLNAENGSKIWSFEVFGAFAISSPAVANGKVYIGGCGNHLFCLNAENGSIIWDRVITVAGPIYASPAIFNEKVYIGSRGGGDAKISCLTADTGDWIWNFTMWYGVISSPAIYNGKIYIGTETNKVYCFNAESGSMIWQFTTGDLVRSSPAIADGKVYVGSYDKKFYCLNAETGTEIWEYLIDNESASSPAVADGMVCVSSNNGTVFMFSANDSPSTPTVTGPQYGRPVTDYTFTSCSYDSNRDDIFYQWTWGDGTSTNWLGPYPCNESQSFTHQWSHDGIYNVTVKSKDVHDAESNWSEPLTIEIYENSPPLKPTITGEQKLKMNTEYKFDFTTTDPNNNNIFYYIDWGDGTNSGWMGPYASGYVLNLKHTWTTKDKFTIQCKAKDIHDAESDWATFSVTTPYSYNIPFMQLWMKIFEQFPNAFPILQYLLGFI